MSLILDRLDASLYAYRVHPNCQDVNGDTPLHLAALNGHKYVYLHLHLAVDCFVYWLWLRSINHSFVVHTLQI